MYNCVVLTGGECYRICDLFSRLFTYWRSWTVKTRGSKILEFQNFELLTLGIEMLASCSSKIKTSSISLSAETYNATSNNFYANWCIRPIAVNQGERPSQPRWWPRFSQAEEGERESQRIERGAWGRDYSCPTLSWPFWPFLGIFKKY